jgi:rubrerythrin
MPEDLATVLSEVAGLLKRIADQNDARQERFKESEGRNKGRFEEMQKRMESLRTNRPDFAQQREDMKRNMEDSRARGAKNREEDVEFRQRLLAEIERHNRLLEKLIERLGDARNP